MATVWLSEMGRWIQVERSFAFSSTRTGGASKAQSEEGRVCCPRCCCWLPGKQWVRVERSAWGPGMWVTWGCPGHCCAGLPQPATFPLHCKRRWRGHFLISCCWEQMSCYEQMWQQLLLGAMVDVRVVSSGPSHPPPICTTVLIHRATLITVQAFCVKSCV